MKAGDTAYSSGICSRPDPSPERLLYGLSL